jgi:hypothetical protein
VRITSLIFVLLLCVAGCESPRQQPWEEVKISVFEKSTQKTRNYSFDVATSAIKSVRAVDGEALPQTTIYSLKDGYLFAGDKRMVEEVELLYQCHFGGYDLVVVRDEYNSYSNPMWALFAFSGHPVQVSKILILKIAEGNLKTKTEIIRKASSYDWRVSVLE